MRRAARDQREGRSMLFDEMCAVQAAAATIPFPHPRVEGTARLCEAKADISVNNPCGDEDKQRGMYVNHVYVRYRKTFFSCFLTRP